MFNPLDIKSTESYFSEIFGEAKELDFQQRVFLLELHEIFQDNCNDANESPSVGTKPDEINIKFEWFNSNDWIVPLRTYYIDSSYIIKMDWRFAATVHLLTNRMYAQPDFKFEVFEDNIDSPETTLKELHFNLIDKLVLFHCSKDPNRVFAANHLALMTLRYLFFHEIVHIKSGHFEYQELFESIGKTGDATQREYAELSLQALEIDADINAVLLLIYDQFERADTFKALANQIPEYIKMYELIYSSKMKICAWIGHAACLSLAFQR